MLFGASHLYRVLMLHKHSNMKRICLLHSADHSKSKREKIKYKIKMIHEKANPVICFVLSIEFLKIFYQYKKQQKQQKD